MDPATSFSSTILDNTIGAGTARHFPRNSMGKMSNVFNFLITVEYTLGLKKTNKRKNRLD